MRDINLNEVQLVSGGMIPPSPTDQLAPVVLFGTLVAHGVYNILTAKPKNIALGVTEITASAAIAYATVTGFISISTELPFCSEDPNVILM